MRSLACTVLLAVVLVAAPAAGQLAGFGQFLGSEADDLRFDLDTDGPQYVLVLDEDDDDRPSTGEQVFLSSDRDTVVAGAIRIANPAQGGLGSPVQSTDSIAGTTATEVTGQLTYRDVDGDDDFERGEPIYWETNEASTSEVSNGDVILSGDDAGTIVSGGIHLGEATTSLDGQFGYVDDNDDNTYNSGDRVFLDLRSDGWASIPDVHLSNQGSRAFGAMATVGDTDISYYLETSDAPTDFVYIDGNGDGDLDGDERVYLSDRTDKIFSDAIRLANPINGEHGSFVGDDPQGEIGDDVDQLSGTLSFDDGNDNNDLDAGETVIYDLSDGNSGEADGNDVILSGGDAGKFVRQVAHLNGRDLDSVPGSIAYVDDDADDDFSFGDVVYLDADSDDFASGDDLQLTTQTMPEPVDSDGDGIADGEDNCPETGNADQTDTDGDGTGDACDDDIDGDGVANAEDNCPETANADQADADGDGEGDACDETPDPASDADGDGVPDTQDNCPETANADQADSDADGQGDACDETPQGGQAGPDTDGDGVPDAEDNCPRTENPDQTDTDGDRAGDACDGDIDGDGLTNARERGMGTDPETVDTDGDGVRDGDDNCPTTANPDQADSDGDGIGDECEEDGVPAPGALVALLSILIAGTLVRSRRAS